MISCVAWVGRGRLSEQPSQYELAPEEVDDIVAKQQAMQLTSAESEKQFDDDDDDDEDGDEEAGMDKLSEHIATANDVDEDDADEHTNGHSDGAAEEDEAVDDADVDSAMSDAAAAGESGAPDAFAEPDAVGDALLAELRMDEYDEDVDGAELFLGGQRLTVHQSNADDPYITVRDEEDDEESDDDDVLIRATDSVLCVGRTDEGEHSAIEVYVYDEDKGTLFVHHDFNIPSFPLCIHFLDQHPRPLPDAASAPAAFLAVGTFLPGIELWNLDVLDVLEPVCTLGGYEDEDATNLKKGKRKLKSGSHEDAVLCMSWHPAHRERLASGSADDTVKLWDVTTQQCTATLTHHAHRAADKAKSSKEKKKKKKGKQQDDESWFEEAQAANVSHKVQSIHFNPTEPSLLLTGSYDRTVHLIDVRAAPAVSSSSTRAYEVESDVEMVRWHPAAPLFLVATEGGLVYLFDARKSDAPIFRLAAHDGAVTSAAFNSSVPSLFLTSGADKTCKLWSIPPSGREPSQVASKEMKVGSIWSAAWDVDVAALMACGGDKGKVAVWDVRESAEVVRRFGREMAAEAGSTGVETEEQTEAAEAAPETKEDNAGAQQRKKREKKGKTKGKKAVDDDGV